MTSNPTPPFCVLEGPADIATRLAKYASLLERLDSRNAETALISRARDYGVLLAALAETGVEPHKSIMAVIVDIEDEIEEVFEYDYAGLYVYFGAHKDDPDRIGFWVDWEHVIKDEASGALVHEESLPSIKWLTELAVMPDLEVLTTDTTGAVTLWLLEDYDGGPMTWHKEWTDVPPSPIPLSECVYHLDGSPFRRDQAHPSSGNTPYDLARKEGRSPRAEYAG